MKRRTFVGAMAAGLQTARPAAESFTARALTRGPAFHWFGYYDEEKFDPTDRYFLGMEVDFQDRLPGLRDRVTVGMIDLKDNNRWIPLSESRAFSWQQGCMLQWLPGAPSTIIYDDREEDRFVARILDVKTGRRRTVSSSIYCVSHDGRWALTTDFRRLRPETRFAAAPEANDDVHIPEDSGIWRVHLETGKTELILRIGDISRMPEPLGTWAPEHWHWFSHLLVAPGNGRFAFVHRWGYKGSSKIIGTRFCTADPDGKNLFIYPHMIEGSHFVWRDAEHVLLWARKADQQECRFYLCRDRSEEAEIFAPDVIRTNSHITYLPQTGKQWVLNDSYVNKQSQQSLYLVNVESKRRVELGRFLSPPLFRGPLRCDLHPCASHDGRKIVFNSPHEVGGRQIYLIDISELAL